MNNLLNIRDLERHLQPISAGLLDIVLELRNLITSVEPAAAETYHWKALSYYDDQRGGPVSAGICQISVHTDHVRLAFIHGAFLPDPLRLLEGNRRYKRFIRIHDYNTAPWEALRDLIAASANLDPRTLKAG